MKVVMSEFKEVKMIRDVPYEFDSLDIVECKLSVGLSGNESMIRLKKVDVLAILIEQDSQEFNTFKGNSNAPYVRVVKDILRIRHIIWPSKLSYDTNGAPRWTTNDVDKTFRVNYMVEYVDGPLLGGRVRTGETYMSIDDLPSRIRSMQLDRVLGE